MKTYYPAFDKADIQLTEIRIIHDEIYEKDSAFPCQVTIIDGKTAGGYTVSITKSDIILEVRRGKLGYELVFEERNAPEQLSREEILRYIGFQVQEGARV